MEELNLMSNAKVLKCLEQMKGEPSLCYSKEATWLQNTVRSYISKTRTKGQISDIDSFVENVKKTFSGPKSLMEAEILQLINLVPESELEIELVIEESETRYTEEEIQKLHELIKRYL
mmetsp:Transcript_7764/g.8908  ORF Transcript_7764/g.8908 Transcript_7764/m.8908 type:complete len:118 (-) Transcript_7764:787-1140(-)